ncbi:hypothetical protein EDD86DRAFT_63059 [Gorgonomyces haynaldii]|nr:hypothetical protein EDD86DRAFT_63059 [Gorgonomyces haynaldii]
MPRMVFRLKIVVHHWQVNTISKDIVPALDYVTMNRNSIKKGIITPKEMREYQATHPVRVKVGEHFAVRVPVGGLELGAQRRRGPLPSDKDPHYTYGNPTRPSTPVARLMTDQYQRQWLDMIAKKQEESEKLEMERLRKKHQQKKAAINHKVIHKTPVLEKDVSTLFKMSKFKKVNAKIDSWRPLEKLPAVEKKVTFV